MNVALELVQSVAGAGHPLLFLKMGPAEWTPVGEENLYSLVSGKNETVSLVICDGDGNSKAMSDFFTESEGARISNELFSKGITKFDGEVKLPI